MPTLTTPLRNGREVVAKMYSGKLMPIGFSSRSQAEQTIANLGDGWTVYHDGRSNLPPFFIAKAEGR